MLERKTASLGSPARTARFIEAGQGLGVSSIANPSNQRRIILESELKWLAGLWFQGSKSNSCIFLGLLVFWAAAFSFFFFYHCAGATSSFAICISINIVTGPFGIFI